jgi:hypothetical protein
MYNDRALKLGSIFLAAFWTAAMVWWSADYDPVHILIMAVCGAVFGLFWYWAMRWFFRRYSALRLF